MLMSWVFESEKTSIKYLGKGLGLKHIIAPLVNIEVINPTQI